MSAIFNDSYRVHQLNELCAHCGKRLGVHNMIDRCPQVTSNGQIVRMGFTDVKFKSTGQFEAKENENEH